MIGIACEIDIDPVVITESLTPGLAEVAVEGANEIAAAAEELLSVFGGGIPSEPGTPPHMQTGKGVSSLRVQPQKDGTADVTIEGGEHLAILDKGTVRIRPRPWIAQAISIGTQNQRVKRGRGD